MRTDRYSQPARQPTSSPGDALRAALRPATARRSVLVAVVVGTLLNAINQGDALVTGGEVNWLKIALTYVVPFFVATYGAYCAHRLSSSQP